MSSGRVSISMVLVLGMDLVFHNFSMKMVTFFHDFGIKNRTVKPRRQEHTFLKDRRYQVHNIFNFTKFSTSFNQSLRISKFVNFYDDDSVIASLWTKLPG